MKTLLALSPLLVAGGAMAQPAAPYRALGTEPFWSLEIGPRSISFTPMDGRPLTVAKPRPVVGINGETYRTARLTVDITHVRCSDGMSDRTFADTVKLHVGNRTLSGCGGAIVPDQVNMLAGTRWTISAIDGRPVRLARPATVTFTANRVDGRICNRYGGGYTVARGTLAVSGVVATRMACPGEAMRVENRFMQAIAGRLYVHRGAADVMVLSRKHVSVTLQRAR